MDLIHYLTGLEAPLTSGLLPRSMGTQVQGSYIDWEPQLALSAPSAVQVNQMVWSILIFKLSWHIGYLALTKSV